MVLSDSNARCEAYEVFNGAGRGGALILCEHASHHIPHRYGDLGLAEADRQSHAAWDPGAKAVALALSAALDSPLIASRISRSEVGASIASKAKLRPPSTASQRALMRVVSP